jgi:hypothetical protein
VNSNYFKSGSESRSRLLAESRYQIYRIKNIIFVLKNAEHCRYVFVNFHAGLQEMHLALKSMLPVFGPFRATGPWLGVGSDLALVDEI